LVSGRRTAVIEWGKRWNFRPPNHAANE